MMERISIVIPVYNRELFLERTLRSIVGQTYRPLEVILVDNNSCDSSYQQCLAFQLQYTSEQFTVLVDREMTPGANAARNKGLGLASGEYITFFDSDDEMLPFKIERIAQTLSEHSKPDVIASTTYLVDEKNQKQLRKQFFSNKVEDQILLGMLATQSLTLKSSFLRQVGGWDESIRRWQDWELGVRILLHHPTIQWIKTPALDCVYLHANSITGNNFSASYHELKHAIQQAIVAVKESTYEDKRKAIVCLYYRQVLLSGLLNKEGEKQWSHDLFADFLQQANLSFTSTLFFRLIRSYVAMGGRGSWKFVRCCATYLS